MTYQKKIIKPKHFELIFTLLFVGCASIPNGLSNHKFDNDIDQEDVYEHIRYLSSDALEGRYPGTKGSQLAIDYISHQFIYIVFLNVFWRFHKALCLMFYNAKLLYSLQREYFYLL